MDELTFGRGQFPSLPDPNGRNYGDISAMVAIRRHWRAIAFFVTGVMLASYIGCAMTTPLYSAQTSVMFRTREPRPSNSNVERLAALPSEEALAKTEIAIIRSRALAETVLSQLSVDADPEFTRALRSQPTLRKAGERIVSWLALATGSVGLAGEQGKTLISPALSHHEQAVNLFLRRLSAKSSETSRVIEIGFISETPEGAARIVNAVASAYIAEKLSEEVKPAQEAIERFDRDINGLNARIRDGEQAIAQLRGNLSQDTNPETLKDTLSDLNKQLITATVERLAAQAKLAELRLPGGKIDPGSASLVLGSPLIQRLQTDASAIAARVAQMSTRYGENYPTLVQARTELNALQARIDAETAKLAVSYRRAVTEASAKEASLRLEIDSTKERLSKATPYEANIGLLQREVDINRSLLNQLAERRNAIKALVNAGTPDAQVISRATIPQTPSFPQKTAILAVAFVLSATGGSVAAAFWERHDNSIRSVLQLRQLTSARILGTIPRVKGERLPLLPARDMPRRSSVFSEQLRAVSFHLDNLRPGAGKIVLITSSLPGEGKSSIAASLARTLAIAGRRTVVVDADLRNPSIHQAFGVNRGNGLSEIVAQETGLAEVLRVDPISGAYVISAGLPKSPPADILESPVLPRLLEKLSGDFDTVIIDSPPILPVHDACILARQVNATIMVARWGKTKVSTFATALARLRDLEIPVSGVVLSMVDTDKYRVYGYADSDIFSHAFRKYYKT